MSQQMTAITNISGLTYVTSIVPIVQSATKVDQNVQRLTSKVADQFRPCDRYLLNYGHHTM